MLRHTAQFVGTLLRRTLPVGLSPANSALGGTRSASHEEEPIECFNERFIETLNKEDLDGWDLRQQFNNIAGMDLYIDPSVAIAGIKACRRLNDIAMAIRWLECVRNKCGDYEKTMWPSIMTEILPVMKELGLPTLADLCYETPELALKSVYD